MGILEWIGFVILAALVVFLTWFIRRTFGFFDSEKYERELQQLSDAELLEKQKALDTLVAYRDDVHLTLALRSNLVRKEVNRRRVGLCKGDLQKERKQDVEQKKLEK